ncbi:MAG: IS1380 family transposase, partial [Chloroflexota bacterium]
SLFGELKSQSQMDYIAVRRLHGNQTYLMAAILAHNLNRELQMASLPPHRHTTEKRTALWEFRDLATLRHHLILRAGRLTCPQGKLTLTMSANESVKSDFLLFLSALQKAA